MTTPLVKPLAREILVAGTAYKVVLTADRLMLTRKGRRSGIELTWDELLAQREADSSVVVTPRTAQQLPRPIMMEAVRDIRAVSAALTRVDEALTQAGALPAGLLATIGPDPDYGQATQRDDWFIEPLLTVAEVASILRLSMRRVRRLPLRSIMLNGVMRYRQSELRDFLRKQESKLR